MPTCYPLLTRYRYFFSPDIERSLSPAESLMGLAKCCINYLCQHHHDEDIDEASFEEAVKNGVYRLHHFAADMWSSLVVSYFTSAPAENNSPETAKLAALLNILVGKRANRSFCTFEKKGSEESPALEILQTGVGKEAYELVRNELEFRQNARARLFELETGEKLAASILPAGHSVFSS